MNQVEWLASLMKSGRCKGCRTMAVLSSVFLLAGLLLSGCQPGTESAGPTLPLRSAPGISTVISPPLETAVTQTALSKPPAAALSATVPLASGQTPAAPLAGFPGRVAFLEEQRITLVDLQSGAAVTAPGRYRELRGWSASGDFFLALRAEDGASVALDAAGKARVEQTDLAQPAFWAGDDDDETQNSEDWLALPQKDGALDLLSLPSLQTRRFYEPGSLGADGQAFVRWGSDGHLILTATRDQLARGGLFTQGFFSTGIIEPPPNAQNLAVGGQGSQVRVDYREDYFLPLDGIPGSDPPRVLGFSVPGLCSSCVADSLQLEVQTLDPPEALKLGVAVLNTPEAYAWNPTQPGLLALASGGSRFTLMNKRLLLLNILSGTQQELTGPDQAVFEPVWSPDGESLAYTVQAAPMEVSGSSDALEALAGGRAIAVYSLQRSVSRVLTHPAPDQIDGWPHWSADGQSLLYARKRLDEPVTEIRRLALVDGADDLLITVHNAPTACHRTGCGWNTFLAYPSTKPLTGVSLSPAPSPTTAQTKAPLPGRAIYRSVEDGFSIAYPADWTLKEAPNLLRLVHPEGVLTIGYRRAAQPAVIQRTGLGAGDLVPDGSVSFLGQTLPRSRLKSAGKTRAVLYADAAEFSAGPLVFTLSLDGTGDAPYHDLDLPADLQSTAEQILASAAWVEEKGGGIPGY